MMTSILIITSILLIEMPNWINGFNCSKSASCQKEIEQMRVEEIKMTILGELGLTGPPVIDKIKMPSAEMREEYRRMVEEDSVGLYNNDGEERETILVPAVDPSGGEDPSEIIAGFDLLEVLQTRNLLEAKLTFYVNVPKNAHSHDIEVQVFEKSLGKELGELIMTGRFSIYRSQRLTIKLNVDDVKRWFSTNSINGLFVFAKQRNSNLNFAIHPQQKTDDRETMILQLTLSTVSRKKRASSPVCAKGAPITGCCLYDLMIDFDRIGWDWIIAPPRYNAYLCRGSCDFNSHHYQMSDNGHTKIMRAALRMGEETRKLLDSVGVCCHPTEYEYVRLVYVNRDGRVSVANVNGMIARKCACT